MPRITDITEQKKDKTRVSVFIDGKFYCGLKKETLIKHSIKIDGEIDLDELNDIQFESEKLSAFDRSVDYLSNSMKTRKQICEYLQKKGYLDGIIKYVVEKMENYNYINDSEYARAYVKTYSNKYGEHKLRYALKNKGVSEKDINCALSEIENPCESAYKLAEKYMRNKTKDYAAKRKLFGYLAGKGFDFDDIRSATDKIYNGEDDGEDL